MFSAAVSSPNDSTDLSLRLYYFNSNADTLGSYLWTVNVPQTWGLPQACQEKVAEDA